MLDGSAESRFLATEYEQAWSHYRHTETQRLQYLGFFFTVSLGGAALAVPLLSSDGLRPGQRLLAAALFLGVFETLTFFVFVSVHKFGAVLAHYLDALVLLRHRSAELALVEGRWATALDTAPSPRLAGMNLRLGVQATAELILQSALVLGFVASGALSGVAAITIRSDVVWASVALACGLATSGLAAGTSLAARRVRRAVTVVAVGSAGSVSHDS